MQTKHLTPSQVTSMPYQVPPHLRDVSAPAVMVETWDRMFAPIRNDRHATRRALDEQLQFALNREDRSLKSLVDAEWEWWLYRFDRRKV